MNRITEILGNLFYEVSDTTTEHHAMERMKTGVIALVNGGRLTGRKTKIVSAENGTMAAGDCHGTPAGRIVKIPPACRLIFVKWIAAIAFCMLVPTAAAALVLTPVTQVQNPTNTPVFVFNATEEGDITYSGCPSGGATETAVPPADTIINFDNTTQGAYTDCRITVTDAMGNSSTLALHAFEIDTTAPVLSQAGISNHTTLYADNTIASVIFKATEQGAINYSDCPSGGAAETAPPPGNTTITFDESAPNQHFHSQITVTDAAGNTSAPLTLLTINTQSRFWVKQSGIGAGKLYIAVPAGMTLANIRPLVGPEDPLEFQYETHTCLSDDPLHYCIIKMYSTVSFPSDTSGTFHLGVDVVNGASGVDNIPVDIPVEYFVDALPTGSVSDLAGQHVNNGIQQLDLTFSDESTQKANALRRFSCDQSTWSDLEPFTDQKLFDVTSEAFGCPPADGPRTVYVQLFDEFQVEKVYSPYDNHLWQDNYNCHPPEGRTGRTTVNTGQFTLDTVPPEFSGISAVSDNTAYPDHAIAGDTVTFHLTLGAADTGGGGIITFSIGTAAGFTAHIAPSDAPAADYTAAYTVLGGREGGLSVTGIAFTDKAGNSLTGFTPPAAPSPTVTVDGKAPTLAEITPIPGSTNDTTPEYTFSSDEAGDITYPGGCSGTTTAAAAGENTIVFGPLSQGAYTDCRITVTDAMGNSSTLALHAFEIDTTAPVLSQAGISNHTTLYADNTIASVIFKATEQGAINYSDCPSGGAAETAPPPGNTTITFDESAPNQHFHSQITVTDAAGNTSAPLTLLTINTQSRFWVKQSGIGAGKLYIAVPAGMTLANIRPLVGPEDPLEFQYETHTCLSDDPLHYCIIKMYSTVSFPSDTSGTFHLGVDVVNGASGVDIIPVDIPVEYFVDALPTGSVSDLAGQHVNNGTQQLDLTFSDESTQPENALRRFSCDQSTWSDLEPFTDQKLFDVTSEAFGCPPADGPRTVYVQLFDEFQVEKVYSPYDNHLWQDNYNCHPPEGRTGRTTVNTGQFTLDTVPPEFSGISAVSDNTAYPDHAIAGDTITFHLTLGAADTGGGGIITFSIGTAAGFTAHIAPSNAPAADYTAAYTVLGGREGGLSVTGIAFTDKAGNGLTGFTPPAAPSPTVTVGGAPTVTTLGATDIDTATATGNGSVTHFGLSNPTEHGVCWSTSADPTTADSRTREGGVGSTGAFTSNITDLSPGVLYHYRAYAVNPAGTSYGTDVTFTTPAAAPTVDTPAGSDITATTATLGGTVSALNGANVTERGVYWSANNGFTPPGQGAKVSQSGNWGATGPFTVSAAGLPPDTRIYYRAFATNTGGTGFSNQADFTTEQASEISVTGGGNPIADGDATPSTDDHTAFADAAVNGGTATRTYTIGNSGPGPLNITDVRITGAHAGDFSVTGAPSAAVASGGGTTMTVTFDPSAAGTRTATINIDSNDTNRTPFDFAVKGRGFLDATLVDLLSFSAVPCPAATCIQLTWETASEMDTAGFHLWRSHMEGGEYAKITRTLIPAEGGSTSGAAYSHVDREVPPGQAWLYKLEEIDTSGAGTFYGPVLGFTEGAAGTCPECSGDPCVIRDVIFSAEKVYDCTYDRPISIGPGVRVRKGCNVLIRAPRTDFRPGYHAEPGAVVRVLIPGG